MISYSEYLVEYDNENNCVYISGLDSDMFWNEFQVETDIAEPESYAWGYAEAMKYNGFTVTVSEVEYED